MRKDIKYFYSWCFWECFCSNGAVGAILCLFKRSAKEITIRALSGLRYQRAKQILNMMRNSVATRHIYNCRRMNIRGALRMNGYRFHTIMDQLTLE